MEYRLLTLEQQDKTAVVRISRPEKKNALSIDLIEELSLMAEDLKKRTDLIAVSAHRRRFLLLSRRGPV